MSFLHSKVINVFSAFDGLSGLNIALKNLGVKSNYYASEIDKYAIQTALHNFPNIIQLGDIKNIKASDLPQIDLFTCGFPCQSFSFAGKQLNFNDDRGKLFFEALRLFKELKPKYFIFENVVMKKEYQDIISKEIGIHPILLDSAKLSAQSRKRLYWTNIKADVFNLFGDKISYIPQPKDKGLILADILEDGFTDREKSYCVTANESKGSNAKHYFQKKRQIIFQDNINVIGLASDIKGYDLLRRIYDINGKSPTITAINGGNQDPKIYQKSRGKNEGGYFENKSPCVSANSWQENNLLMLSKDSYRKLTVRECARLQTIPDWFEFPVSNSQAYKMIGNGFTIDIISYILSHID